MSLDFNWKPINYVCDCGRKPHGVRIGVTSRGELIAFWICNTCRQEIMCRIPLERLIEYIPDAPTQKLLVTQSDADFLKGMLISMPEDA